MCLIGPHGIYILRFTDGKIAEVWNHWDNLNVLEQLGAGTSSISPGQIDGD